MPSSTKNVLENIADTLGCEVEDFYEGPEKLSAVLDRAELIDLWSRITTEQGRQALLVFAREAANLSN